MQQLLKEEKLYFSGDEFFSDISEGIASASESVHVEFYIYENDPLAARINENLIAAVRRGLDVKVIVDGVGASNFEKDFNEELRSAGIKTKIFHPLPKLEFLFFLSKRKRIQFVHLLGRVNKRTHRKMLIIDEKIAWTGSLNLSAKHLREFYGEKAWRDTGVRISGPEVSQLVEAFNSSWRKVRPKFAKKVKNWYRQRKNYRLGPVRLNTSLFLRRSMQADLIKRIRSAKSRIWITTAYFVPHRSLLRAFKKAKKNRVDVRILVPQNSDVFFMPWISSIYCHELAKASVTVYYYLPRILHAKTVLIDDWAMVGSTNLNHRSFMHDLEVDVELTRPENVELIASQFEKDTEESYKLSAEDWRRQPYWKRWLGKLLFLFRHWL